MHALIEWVKDLLDGDDEVEHAPQHGSPTSGASSRDLAIDFSTREVAIDVDARSGIWSAKTD